MITHENLVDAVNQSTDAWSCPNWEEECDNCGKCGEWLVTEYENSLREEALAEALKPYDAEDIEDLIRNVRNKTINEVIRYISTHVYGWQDLRDFLEQMKEGVDE